LCNLRASPSACDESICFLSACGRTIQTAHSTQMIGRCPAASTKSLTFTCT
jgi:hypothetical protein